MERLGFMDRSETGISEDCPRASPLYSRGRGHSPPRSARGPCSPGPESNAVKPSQAGSSQVVSRVNPVAGRASQRSLNGAMQAIRQDGQSLDTQACSRIPCIVRLSPGHATPGAESNQFKFSQVKLRVTSGVPPAGHARAAVGRAWPMPRTRAPPRHAPRPPKNGLPRARTHGRGPR